MPSITRQTAIAVVAALGLSAGGAAAVVAAVNDSSTDQPDPGVKLSAAPVGPPPEMDAPAIKAIPEDLASHLGVFRRDQRSDDIRYKGGVGMYGSSFDLARAVETSAGTVSLLPGRGHICIHTRSGGGCGTIDEAMRGQLVYSKHSADGLIRAFVVVPDGTTNATVEGPEGSTGSVSIQDNVVAVDDKSATSVSFTLPDGSRAEADF